MICLWEILVPTKYGDTLKPIRLRHHKRWDEYIRKIAGGLTILRPAKGQWLKEKTELFEEKVIPVRVACTRSEIDQIIQFTLSHYRQHAVMAYKLSEEVLLVKNPKEI